MNYRSFIDLSRLINAKLPYLHKIQADLVVGVPRSGIIPAYLVGLGLNLKVTDLNGLLTNQKLLTGSTRKTKSDFDSPWDARKILIVDDSIASGRSFERIRNQLSQELRKKVEFLAVFSSRPKRKGMSHSLLKFRGVSS